MKFKFSRRWLMESAKLEGDSDPTTGGPFSLANRDVWTMAFNAGNKEAREGRIYNDRFGATKFEQDAYWSGFNSFKPKRPEAT
jgi:hypothetical protein